MSSLEVANLYLRVVCNICTLSYSVQLRNTMASTSAPVPTSIEKVEEAATEHVENQDNEKNIERHDRFGSVAKTDPKEIALVRKIDLYLMVREDLQAPDVLTYC